MSKLIPSWGMSPQPGSTYYLQKLSHDIFGIVNHSNAESRVYIFDERLGPKNSDHTISYLNHYLSEIPSWIKRVHIFLDNAGSTNKNMYTMAWAMEMVQHHKFDIVRISFMIAGHTKFSVDQLFSRIAQSFNRSDVFNTTELGKIAEPYASVIIDEGDIVMEWRDCLTKYTKMPGIRSQQSSTGNVQARVRELCHEGELKPSTLKVAADHLAEEEAIPKVSYNHVN